MLGDTSKRVRRSRHLAAGFGPPDYSGDSGGGGFDYSGLIGGAGAIAGGIASLFGGGSSSSSQKPNPPIGGNLPGVPSDTLATSTAQALFSFLPIARWVAIVLGLICIAGAIYLFRSTDINAAIVRAGKTAAEA